MTIDRASRCPPSATQFYALDIDVAIMSSQLAMTSSILENAINTGGITLSIQDPTPTTLAVLAINVTTLNISMADIIALLRPAANNFGYQDADVQFIVGNGSITVNIPIELYVPSAMAKTIVYNLADYI